MKFTFSSSFDVILDPFGGEVGEKYATLLAKWKGANYVTLAPPLLSNTDQFGTGLGILSAGQSFTSSALQKVRLLRRIPLNVRAISAKNIYQKTTQSTVTF